MGFVIVVDGPNFVNDLHRFGKDVDYILNTFSFHTIHGIIQRQLNIQGLRGHPFVHTYFVCADRGKLGKFNNDQKMQFLEKLSNEQGVTVDKIIQSHKRGEQQVDMSVFIRMLTMGPFSTPQHDPWRHIVLIASDSDYVPAIRMLSSMGTHTITVGFRELGEKRFPQELINESFLFLELNEILIQMEHECTI
jgi:hypothetical protein